MHSPKTIFVVDDDEEQADLVALALCGADRTVRPFSDPIAALIALRHEPADVLIADLSMPWVDGGEIVDSALAVHPELAVVMVSGFERGADLARVRHVPFFHKPIDVEALRGCVERLLASRRS